MKLVFSAPDCIGCSLCMLACSGEKTGGFNPRLARIHIESEYDGTGLQIKAAVCEACLECVGVCPTNAIVEKEGRPFLQEELCTGCGSCIQACPTGVLRLMDDKPLLCDYCDGQPLCVAWCPHGALQLEVR
ncbi:MAG: 4Fe-4S binding protein [Bacillota bacterium]|uniref:4Fe-4S binding protein n=1 Tax=Desulfurispora thermophila TaxID=265470 RepID=UPI00037C40B9|nr:4Fe-4S binding protein [Desulfurispora thermophila]